MKHLNGWLIYNGSLQSEKFNEIHTWYKRTAETKNITLELVKNSELFSIINQDSLSIQTEGAYVQPDFVLFLDKDIRLAKHLEALGYKLFNSAAAIEACDDKMITYQILSQHGIKVPKSIFSPMMFTGTKEQNNNFVDMVEKELDYPLVIKEAFGSFGEQVYLVNNRKELIAKRKELLYIPHLYQEFIETSRGKDVRVHVVGDQVVASMLRVSEHDFRANVTNGGKMHSYHPSESFKELAIKASNTIGTDFSGVDLMFGENDEPIICEVNSNAHIKNIYDCSGIDVTAYIFDYIRRKIEHE